MAGWDDDDWAGTPPEGRHSRDQAKPAYWWTQRPARFGFVGVLIVLAILLVVVLLA